jgi:hypothetical protein
MLSLTPVFASLLIDLLLSRAHLQVLRRVGLRKEEAIMTMKASRILLSLLAGVGLMCTLFIQEGRAQVLYGSVTGTVSDPTGAVVPGAKVLITNDQTELKRLATTDSAGEYRILDLPEGTYTINVTAPGFQAFKQTSLVVAIGQVNKQDLQLTVGSQTQEVTVQGSTEVLQTQKADVHTEITTFAVQKPSAEHVQEFPSDRIAGPGRVFDLGHFQQLPEFRRRYPRAVVRDLL